jgi:hypothetical protein
MVGALDDEAVRFESCQSLTHGCRRTVEVTSQAIDREARPRLKEVVHETGLDQFVDFVPQN